MDVGGGSHTRVGDDDTRIVIGRIAFAQRGRRTARRVTIGATVLIAVMLVPLYPPWVPASWLAASLLLVVVRGRGRGPLEVQGVHAGNVARWERNILVSTALYGMLWSCAGGLFVVTGEAQDVATGMVVLAAALIGGLWTSSVRGAFLMYALILLVPSLTMATTLQIDRHLAMCATMLLVGAASVRLAGNIQRIVVETLQLRAENEDVLQRLTIKSEQAEAASREKSRFMAAASHDLRQPMQALTLTVDALAGHLRDRVGAQMLRRMHQSMEALNELFDSLLDLSRLDAGQYPVLPGPVLLGPLLDALRDQYAAEAQARGLRLAVLPTRACTRSDEVHLRRILSNLVGNAIKFTRHGSVCVAVRRAGSSAWRIEVRDSGPGIPVDRQEAVFQEYVQLEDPETPRRQGLGLGLAIVRRLAAAMDHPVSLRSRPGQGAVFALTVPRLAEDAAQDAPALEPVAGPDLAGVRVLIVEDDAAVRESLVAVLDRWECRTQLAASLDDALAVAASSEQPPDAVICDYRLGGSVTGLDVVEALRRHWNRPLAVAIISGEDDEATLAAIRQAGLMRVRKPVRPAVLRALLGALMRRTADTA